MVVKEKQEERGILACISTLYVQTCMWMGGRPKVWLYSRRLSWGGKVS